MEGRRVVVITGRGKHVLKDGRRGVLREEVTGYLREGLGLEVGLVEGNEGRVEVTLPQPKQE
jgi:hypothetical protein